MKNECGVDKEGEVGNEREWRRRTQEG